MSTELPPTPPDAPTRERFVRLMRRLRGDVPLAEVARRIPAGQGAQGRTTVAPQTVMLLERDWHQRRNRKNGPLYWNISNPSLERLEELGRVYGVVFEVIARDVETGAIITRDAPGLRRPAPEGTPEAPDDDDTDADE